MEKPNRDELIQLYLDGAKEIFPDLETSTVFSMIDGEIEFPSSGKIELNNKIFDIEISKSTTYEVIHYTSLNAFLEIINSQSLRIYNCNNLNDPKEIEHALNQMNFKYEEEWIEKWKRNHFILSTSRYDNQINDDFNMWRLYGQNGMGVGLVFEVPKEINNWKSVTIKEVDYTSKNSESKTKKFIDFHQQFQDKYKLFENIPSIIPLIASFHKDEIWSMENETRLVAHCPFDEYTFDANSSIFENGARFLGDSLTHTINTNGFPVAYIEMPISRKIIEDKKKPEWKQEFADKLLRNHPYIQLKSIVIGPQLVHSSSFNHLIPFICNIVKKKTGCDLDIIHSNFSSLYKKI